MPDRKISYAQNGEDVRLWRALQAVEQPFYVEIGASDPYEDSITASLSSLGWSGLLVEADAATAARLRAARPLDTVVAAAASDAPGELRFSPGSTRGLGHVAADEPDAVVVPAVRVGDALAELQPQAVHAMTVDVEGGERAALEGADLGRWRPWVLCVEATRPNSRELAHGEWEHLVLEAGYRFTAFDGLNRWYVHEDHADLAEAVATPYNVLDELLDGWVRRRDVQAQEHAAQAAEEATRTVQHVQRVQDALDAAREEVGRLQAELAAVTDARDQALAREQVMLTSKSWRLTAPMRTARYNAGLALVGRLPWRSLVRPAPPPAEVGAPLPGDDRRWAALHARVRIAREQVSR